MIYLSHPCNRRYKRVMLWTEMMARYHLYWNRHLAEEKRTILPYSIISKLDRYFRLKSIVLSVKYVIHSQNSSMDISKSSINYGKLIFTIMMFKYDFMICKTSLSKIEYGFKLLYLINIVLLISTFFR